MTGELASPLQRGNTVEPIDNEECPICYQEYNQHNKCPRMLECLHVFCTECLQKIQLRPCDLTDAKTLQCIACPLCRHFTPLENGGALNLPSNSRILSRLPRAAYRPPADRFSVLRQKMVLSWEDGSTDTRAVIVPTVSQQVQQLDPERSNGSAPGLLTEEELMEASKWKLACVQLLAVVLWVLFVIICVYGVVRGRF